MTMQNGVEILPVATKGAAKVVTELSLDEMLVDPIVRLVMKRDRVTEAHVRDTVKTARAAYLAGRPGLAA